MTIVAAVSKALADRSSRRGFLMRTAIGSTALAANPSFVVRPVSAYAAVCQCRSQPCSCGSACCDGYTEFCCAITGRNDCPPGTALGGWWKADGGGWCGNAPRYYLDCNVVPGGTSCSCRCAGNSCSNRVTCCVHFRYGQCHQEIPVMGAIMCRVVTCTAPWELDPTCTTAVAVDQATLFHDAACLHTTPEEDEMKRWLMRAQGNAKVYLVDGGLAWRWHIPNEAQLANVRYALGQAGVTILAVPAGGTNEGGVWVVDPGFLSAIPETTNP